MQNIPTLIVIEPYRLEWPQKFSSEAIQIRCAIGSYLTALEHIGSTAVPGLAAKPIIDILIGVRSLTNAPSFIPPLTKMGYIYVPQYEVDLPDRRYLYKQINGEDSFHLHIVEPESEFFRRHIAFRDYLRAHPEAVAEYAALKVKLSQEFGSDRAGYTDAKTEFIRSIERKALPKSEV